MRLFWESVWNIHIVMYDMVCAHCKNSMVILTTKNSVASHDQHLALNKECARCVGYHPGGIER